MGQDRPEQRRLVGILQAEGSREAPREAIPPLEEQRALGREAQGAKPWAVVDFHRQEKDELSHPQRLRMWSPFHGVHPSKATWE